MNKVEALRTGLGWSRSELARRARMDAADVSKIERGILRPYPGQLMKLAKALGVKAMDIADDMNRGGING